ncbi:MAG: hypothetical protein IH594_02790 [Bacteroidales bacterium]|nr:hypothetical protein [Bacteroidales bacterium]
MTKNLTFNNYNFLYDEGFFRKLWSPDGIELIRAVYPAVRNKNWGTVPITTDNELITQSKEEFILDTRLIFFQKEIHFSANLSIKINASGFVFEFDGQAHSSFLKNRIGLNLLLPVDELAGCDCMVTDPEQRETKYTFPSEISSHQPFVNIRGLRWRDMAGNEINASFEGDVFEIEDQRNWTDASFKIYSTPLHLPFPDLIEKGERIHQKISLRVAHPISFRKQKKVKTLQPDSYLRGFRLPKIGTGASSEKEQMTDQEAKLIKETGIDFCSMFCDLENECWKQKILEHFTICKKMGINARLNFAVPKTFTATDELIALIIEQSETIDGVEFYAKENFLSLGKNIEVFLDIIKRSTDKIEIGGGTYAYYAELNRSFDLPKSIDYISFSISPQVHAFDDLTLIENLQGIHYAASDAARKYGLPVDINALTLKQRMNFVATSKEARAHEESILPETVDPRQASEFIAIWTLGAISKLMFAGVRSVSLFETLGRKGIMQSERPLPGYGIFTEQPLYRYAVYFVLRELLRFKDSIFQRISIPGTEYVSGFHIHHKNGHEKWVWNYGEKEQKIPGELLMKLKTIKYLNLEKGEWIKTGNIDSVPGKSLLSIEN